MDGLVGWARSPAMKPRFRDAPGRFCPRRPMSQRDDRVGKIARALCPAPRSRQAILPTLRHLAMRDERGAVLVEVTVMMTIMFVFLLGAIEFLFAFYQWNAAAKAVQIGARIAAVSDPVAIGLNRLS